MLDLVAEGEALDLSAISRLQQLKTGALIEYAVEAACIMGRLEPRARTPYRGYARDIGLAFQIADDLLDHGGDEAVAGKRLDKDADAGKATFVCLMGEERARQQCAMLVDQAIEHLARPWRRGRPAPRDRALRRGKGSLMAALQRIGVYPGTFDPLTLGHLDIIRRGAHLVDRLVIGVTTNPSKSPMFSVAERIAMVDARDRRPAERVGGRVQLAADGLRRARGRQPDPARPARGRRFRI